MAFDVSLLTHNNSGTLDHAVRGFFVKPDGTQLWTSEEGNANIRVWSMTSGDPSTASKTTTHTLSNGGRIFSIAWKPDGTKLYALNKSGITVDEYSISTPWDITTETFVQSSITLHINSEQIRWKPDGTKLFVALNAGGILDLSELSLSSAWDISTMSLIDNNELPSMKVAFGVDFVDSGETVIASDFISKVLRQYSITAWDASTATNTGLTKDVSNFQTSLYQIQLSDDELYLYALHAVSPSEIHRYNTNQPDPLEGVTVKGRDFLLQVEEPADSGTYINIGGLTNLSYSINNTSVDETDKYSNGVRQLTPNAGVSSYSLSFDFYYKGATTDDLLMSIAHGNTQRRFKVITGSPTDYIFVADSTSYERGGAFDGLEGGTVTLESSGAVTEV